jgi:hypothetical protein
MHAEWSIPNGPTRRQRTGLGPASFAPRRIYVLMPAISDMTASGRHVLAFSLNFFSLEPPEACLG